ncbi:hypothetical protein FA15DRAFT_668035 [Coprinopsis marcescibilis]|uniref:Uncharacterized protein n=1 Tax=Coprinopsis marcescibilis TaxID=230819 RepID=A0A5C3KZY9_COPMA|nr:hypothetical protein FA15DRAFT_668035 [Coprinopsis marcescibilis]
MFSQPILHLLSKEIPDLSLDVPDKYAEHINTNYVPSAEEQDELKAFSSTITSKAQLLTSEISQLEEQLSRLKVRQTMLKKAAAPYESLASPLRRFPPELVQYIFMACLPESRNAVMHCSEAPLLLGRVCSKWRRISLNTPALWSTLHIVPPHYSSDSVELSHVRFQRKKEVVEAWLGRSGAYPLSVSFVWFGSHGEEELRLCGSLLSLLVPLSKRWRLLDFQMPLRMCRPFVGLGADDVPLLEGITLTDNRSNPGDFEDYNNNATGLGLGGAEPVVPWPEQLQFAARATNLRRLNLTFFAGGIQLPGTIDWSQLTSLSLESNVSFFFRDGEEMMQTLDQCKALQSCTLKLPLSISSPHGPIPGGSMQLSQAEYHPVDHVVTLPELTFLCVDGDQNLFGPFHMTATLANINAPKLKELEIYGRTGRGENFDNGDDSETVGEDDNGGTGGKPVLSPEPLAGLRKLLRQSQCPLEKLKLESVTLVEKEFLACMVLAPRVKDLVVRDYGVRMGFSRVTPKDDEKECVEDRILKALTIPKVPPLPPPSDSRSSVASEDIMTAPPSPATSTCTILEDDSILSMSPVNHPIDVDPLRLFRERSAPVLPNLTHFEFAVSCGSQELFCSFVESRFLDSSAADHDVCPYPLSPALPISPSRSLSPSRVSSFTLSASDDLETETEQQVVCDDHTPTGDEHDEHDLTPMQENMKITTVNKMISAMNATLDTDTDTNTKNPDCTNTITRDGHAVSKLKSIKCTFTAQEDVDIRRRLGRMKEMGLHVGVVFHMPLPDELVPSPWSGVEGI